LAAVFLVLLAYGAGSIAYVAAFRGEREPGTIVLAVPSIMVKEGELLAGAFTAADPGSRVLLLDAQGNRLLEGQAGDLEGGAFRPPSTWPTNESAALAELLARGTVDYVLAVDDTLAGLRSAGTVLREPRWRFAYLLSLPFPAVTGALSLPEAEALLDAKLSGREVSWPDSRLHVMSLSERAPSAQLLEVEGVYPTLGSVSDGSYPLTTGVRVVARRPSGLLGLVSRLPFVRGWALSSRPVVGEFEAWLETEEAQGAFYGTRREVRLTAVGDVMLGRGVTRDLLASGQGTNYPFGLVADRLKAADIAFCNLEAPLSLAGTPIPGKMIWLQARPEYVDCLEKGGIDVVGLANNHILDFDTPGLVETIAVLDKAGIAHCGGGANITEARRPAILEAGGLRVAFLAYTEFADEGLFWDYTYRRSFEATDDIAGCSPLRMEIIAEDIASARERADVVIVTYHWGLEDIPYPQAFNPANDLRDIARRTIALGASVVLGTHPHAVQGFELHPSGFVAYSLGNFIMDQRRPTQKESMILEIVLGDTGVLSARALPVWIDTTRPRVLEGEEASRLLEKFQEISEPFQDSQ